MDRIELRALGTRVLEEARAIRAAYPNAGTMRELSVSDVPEETSDSGDGMRALRSALRYLRSEMLLGRAGRGISLTVLDDESANVEHLMAAL